MLFDQAITFTIVEWSAIMGMVLTGVILFYIFAHVRDFKRASIAIAYFSFMAAAFAVQFDLHPGGYKGYVRFVHWFIWAMSPSLCYLLVLQVVRATLPPPRYFLVLLSVPLTMLTVYGMTSIKDECDSSWWFCPQTLDALYWTGATIGAFCVLGLWIHGNIFTVLWNAKGGRERYWLVIMLVLANLLALSLHFMRAADMLTPQEADGLLVLSGFAFVYLAMMTIFRVYPDLIQQTAAAIERARLSPEEEALAEKIRALLELDKVYHEQSFSRADLAREVGVSENTVSKIINASFGQSFPKLLNEYRVADAKRMLENPDIAVQVIAFEVGFNSLASFNRVFREVTGMTPTAYRISLSGTAEKH